MDSTPPASLTSTRHDLSVWIWLSMGISASETGSDAIMSIKMSA
jgi:hypothetical protein